MTADVNSTDGRSRRWDDHRAQRRAEFVAAAITALERDGPDASVGAIAREAGVGRPVLYRHFTDKADLEAAVAETVADDMLAGFAPLLRVEGTLADSIARATDAYLDWLLAHPNLERFLRRHAAATDRMQATAVTRVAELARQALTRSGVVPAEMAPMVGAAVIGLSDAAIHRWLDDPGGVDRVQVTALVVRMIEAASASVLTTPARS